MQREMCIGTVDCMANLDALFLYVRVFRLLLVSFVHITCQLLRSHRVYQPRKKVRGKTNLAGVPDDRCNSSARIRTRCVCTGICLVQVSGEHHNLTTVIVPPSIAVLVYMQVVPPTRTTSCMYGSETNERTHKLGWHPR